MEPEEGVASNSNDRLTEPLDDGHAILPVGGH
jgi:hypothetical protein